MPPLQPPEGLFPQAAVEPIFGDDDIGAFEEHISWEGAMPANGVYVVVAQFRDAPPLITKFSVMWR